eukprot:351666_1
MCNNFPSFPIGNKLNTFLGSVLNISLNIDQYFMLGIGIGIGFIVGYLVTKKISPKEENIIKYKSTQYRRFVTGHDKSGQSMVVINDSIENQISMKKVNVDVYNIWRCLNHNKANKDNNIELTDLCDKFSKIPLEPHDNGSNFRIVEFKPETTEYKQLYDDSAGNNKNTIENVWKDFGVKNDGNVYDKINKKHPFMHRTESIDYAICLYGKIILVLDKSETIIEAGDMVVQRATNHAWKNVFNDTCIICFILIHSDKYESIQ